MNKVQHSIILFLILLLLRRTTNASAKQILPVSIQKSPLEKMPSHTLKIILGYVDTSSGFEILLACQAFYRTLAFPLTEMMYTAYAALLTTPASDCSVVRFRRYTAFLQYPLDPTVPFPVPTLVYFTCTTWDTIERNTDAFLFTDTRHQYQRERTDPTKLSLIVYRVQYPLHPLCALPLSYDPSRGQLRLCPQSTEDTGMIQRVRLPAVLLFLDSERRHVEYVATWRALEWRHLTDPIDIMLLGFVNTITWVASIGIVRVLVNSNGKIYRIYVTNPHMNVTFQYRTSDKGQTYTLLRQHVMTTNYPIKMIQAFYYPWVYDTYKYDSSCACNIL